MIATPLGETAIEQLKRGDEVRTPLGSDTVVGVWCFRHPPIQKAWPFRIPAGGFGPGMPDRDLYTTGTQKIHDGGTYHCVRRYADHHQRKIARIGSELVPDDLKEVVYFHIELADTGSMYANGLEVESFQIPPTWDLSKIRRGVENGEVDGIEIDEL